MMNYTSVLMDADDTIFDFPKCEYTALKNTLNIHQLVFNDEVYHTFSKINSDLWKQLELKKITRYDLRIQRFQELIRKCFDGFENCDMLADEYVNQLSRQAILIDGAASALEKISSCADLYIITNGLKVVQRGRLKRTDITRFIKKVYISDEIGINKPDKAFFDFVLSDIPEKDLSNIIVVGDSLSSDMQGGRNAGLTTCLYDPKDRVVMPHPLCDFKIKNLEELLSL